MPQNVKQKIRHNLKKGLVILEDTVRKTKVLQKRNRLLRKNAPQKRKKAALHYGNLCLFSVYGWDCFYLSLSARMLRIAILPCRILQKP